MGKIHNEGLDFIFAQVQSLEQKNPSLRANAALTMTTVQLATVSRDYLQTTPNYTALYSSYNSDKY